MLRPRLNRLRCLLLGVVLAVSSCGGDEPARLTEPVVGGDLVLVMQPGEGTETNTGRYLVEIFDPDGKYGLREGTANHVGWIESEYGPRHVVTFTAGRDNPRGGEPELCVIVVTVGIQAVRDEAATFNGGGACGLDADEPMILGGNLGSGSRESARIPMISGGSLGSASLEPADVYGGADGAEAVITTESGKTVSVLTTRGFALAEWPREWGLLQMVDFYDVTGDLVGAVELHAYPEGRQDAPSPEFDVDEVEFATESGKTVSVVTAGGFAHADWPEDWGPPQMVDFDATTGELVITLEMQTDPEG